MHSGSAARAPLVPRSAQVAGQDLQRGPPVLVERDLPALAVVLEALRGCADGFIVTSLDRQRVLDAVDAALSPNSCQLDRLRDQTDDTRAHSSHRAPAAAISPGTDSGSTVERLHGLCRDLAAELREILEAAVDTHRADVTLQQILALEYEQLCGPLGAPAGPAVRRRASAEPVQGFGPPRFQTADDAIVDRAMMQRMGCRGLRRLRRLLKQE